VSEARPIASVKGRQRPASKEGERPAKAGGDTVKYPSLRRHRVKPDAGSETGEARVLVDRVMGSRSRSDASCVVRHGEPQGEPAAGELAERKPQPR
jgi:hypothetical protein